MRKCILCPATIPDSKFRCPECHTWQWTSRENATSQSESVLLEDIISAEVDRLTTGPWDVCFGQPELADGSLGTAGIVRGSVNLIGGSPGAGKSTLFLQMAEAAIRETDMPVLYLSAEEQLPQIRARADRLKIKTNRKLRFIDMRRGSSDLASVLAKWKFCMLILDSLKAMAESPEDCIEICKIIKECATVQHAPAIIAQHVNKGLEMAGLMALQHEVDSTMTFFPDPDDIDEESGEAIRTLETIKNRNGRAFAHASFKMTGRGLVEHIEEDTEDEDE